MNEASSPGRSDEVAIAIVGAGSIGTAFALVHAAAGHHVYVYDVSAERRQAVPGKVADTAADLRRFGLVEDTPEALRARIHVVATLADAVSKAALIHECAPEDRALKRELLAAIAPLAPANAVVASASSAIPASEIADAVEGRDRFLIAHPGNPPFLLRTIEIVPAPFTSGEAVATARRILEAAGMSAITVRKEIRGFVFNRLQGALLREAYCLVRDGVASVEDIDRLVRDGLGLRWAVVGPFEAVDLNTRGGIGRHAKLLGPAYEAMGAERGQHDPWTDELVEDVEAQRRCRLPLEDWEDRVAWRNRQIMAVLAARSSADEDAG
jgi:3-hydroxyacyl-CoA dehydrogenase